MKELRRQKLRELLAGPRFNGDRDLFLSSAVLTKGRLSQLLDPALPFGDTAVKNLCEKLGIPESYFNTPTPNQAQAPVDGAESATKVVARHVTLKVALTALGQWAMYADDLTRDQVRPLVNRMFDEPQRSAEIIARIIASIDSEITPLDGPNLTPHDKVRAAQVNQAAKMADSFQPFKDAKSKT